MKIEIVLKINKLPYFWPGFRVSRMRQLQIQWDGFSFFIIWNKKGKYKKQPLFEVIGMVETTSDEKLMPIVAVRSLWIIGSLFVEQMSQLKI